MLRNPPSANQNVFDIDPVISWCNLYTEWLIGVCIVMEDWGE